ncbi:MAG: CHAD domain-containing protein [Alphaproteobacteria bacterium]
MEIATETELKLATRPSDLPALTRLLEARAGGGPGREARLVSTYFDTPDGALASRGLTFRVREQDGRFIQTVKSSDGANGSGLALVRGEWEDPVPDAHADPRAPQTGRFVAALAADDLLALVRTEICRRVLMLCPDARTRIEAAVDRGHVMALQNDRREPICEIELELKHGNITALYDFALEMLAVAPVRLERCSKSARGFRLSRSSADRQPVAAVHAGTVALDPDMASGLALRRIAGSCVEQIVGNEAAVLDGMAEGVHQMRVGVRRLRAILSAFARLLPQCESRWFSDELRWLGATLGIARNLDVFANGLVAPAIRSAAGVSGMAALNAAVASRRAAAYANAVEAIGSTRYTALVLRLMRWSEAPGGGEDPSSPGLARSLGEIAPEILTHRLKVTRRRAARFSKQSPEDRHRLRIALKKLRYAVEMLGQLYDRESAGILLRAVKQLQEELGDINDLRVSRDIVTELACGGADAAAIADAGAVVLDRRARLLRQNERGVKKHAAKIREFIPFW